MRYSHAAALLPPAQAEALYDLALEQEDRGEPNNKYKIVSGTNRAASNDRAPRRAPSENPVQLPSVPRTNP